MPPADTLPNAAFIDDPAVVSDKRLDSLHFPLSPATSAVDLSTQFQSRSIRRGSQSLGSMEASWRLVLMVEIHFKIFLPRAAASLSGGYNRTISADRGSPIAGRQAWSGNSEGFITTMVNLPLLPQAAGSAGEWPAITAAPAKAGALTRLLLLCANRFRVSPPTPRPRVTPAPRPVSSAPPSPHGYACVYTGTSAKPVIPDEAETLYNNSLTSDFSSFNSANDASIFERLKSFIGSPCTISHFPPRTRTGNDEINPFSTP